MKARANNLEPGDRVAWNTARGKTRGVVKKKITRPTRIKRHQVNASRNEPAWLVTSLKTGKPAAHQPATLKKIKSTGR